MATVDPDKAGTAHPRVGPVGEMQKSLAGAVAAAVAKAVAEGRLPSEAVAALAGVGDGHIEVPRDAGHGDLASTACLRLAGPCRLPPRRVAEEIARGIDLATLPVERVEVAGPGFLNFYLEPRWLNRVVGRIVSEGKTYGRSSLGGGVPVQVEFVSANPTGPLGVVNARAAAVGDALAAALGAIGFASQREYYINDAGGQVERLGRSVEARWLELQGREAAIPEGGYRGEYIIDIAKAYEAEHGDEARGLPSDERALAMGRFATNRMVENHRSCLAGFGVNFDVWYSQNANVDRAACNRTLAELEAGGHVYRQAGAIWLRTTTFGDDKDRVLVKSNGQPTYFLADIAYHRDKFARGFQRVIDLWGPDHHGHIRRMKAAVRALGFEEDALEILIVQWVRLLEGGQLARMSKRRGQIVPMEDLVQEVGVDAARFFFLMRSHESHLDFDLDLAKLKTSDNPVYYVQYAHARICSILRQPEAQAAVAAAAPGEAGGEGAPPGEAGGVDAPEGGASAGAPAGRSSAAAATGVALAGGGIDARESQDGVLGLLGEPAEVALIRQLADFPEEVAGAALAREPHRLTRYALEVATAFHKFYDTCRVLTDDLPLRRARLALADATRIVIANALGLCGVSAPDKM